MSAFKSSKRINYNLLLFFVVLFVFLLYIIAPKKVSAGTRVAMDLQPLSYEVDDLSVRVSYGFDGIVKYGRNATISVIVTNRGRQAFSGAVSVLLEGIDGIITSYQKELILDSTEEQVLKYNVLLSGAETAITVCILNGENKLIDRKDYRLDCYYLSNRIFIGTLSNHNESLNYLGNLQTYVLPLNKEDIPRDEKELEQLDFLVIDDYDMTGLREEQRMAIQGFVNNGGSLVLGLGNRAEAMMSLFKQFDIPYELGERYQKEISYGTSDKSLAALKQKVDIYETIREENLNTLNQSNLQTNSVFNYANAYEAFRTSYYDMLHMDNWEIKKIDSFLQEVSLQRTITTIKEGDTSLAQTIRYGKGKITVFSTTLDLLFEEHQMTVLAYLLDNISSTKGIQLQNEQYGASVDDRIISSMNGSGITHTPKTYQYIILVIIYLFIIGPVIFLILKKCDKLFYYWFLVPMVSVFFSAIIYFMGSSTRVDDPFLHYVNIVELDQTSRIERMYFGITVPSDERYTLRQIDNSKIAYLNSKLESFDNIMKRKLDLLKRMDSDKVNLVLYDNAEDEGLILQNNKAFTQINFSAYEEKEEENKVIQNIEFTEQGIRGELQNTLGYDLDNAVLLCDDFFILVGDLKKDTSICVDDLPYEYFQDRTYSYMDTLAKQVFYAEEDVYHKAKQDILEYIIDEKAFQKDGECYLIGFTKKGLEHELLSQLSNDLDCNGFDTVIYKLSKENIFSNGWQIDLDSYAKLLEGDYMSYYDYRYMNSGIVDMKYSLPKEDKVQAFYYLKCMNPEYNREMSVGFVGTISFYNYRTQNYDVIFHDDDTQSCTQLEDYLNQDNEIVIRYQVDSNYLDYFMSLPFVSYKKESAYANFE